MGPVLIGILPNNLHCLTRDATLAAQTEARIHNNLFSVLQQETVILKLSFCQNLHCTEKDDNKIEV